MDNLLHALNILIWKMPLGRFYGTSDLAQHMVSCLEDGGIHVRWNKKEERFEETDE